MAQREAPHGRLWADDRRRQLLSVAAEVLEKHGVDGVRIPDVAAAAGVTRPVVYKHFPNRQALIMALLEDHGAVVELRLKEALRVANPQSLDEALRAVIEATCDVIAERGAGAWRLLGSSGPDPEIEKVARQVREEVMLPWLRRITRVTGVPRRDVAILSQMIQATINSVLTLWVDDALDRTKAVDSALRGVGALIREYER